MAYDQNAGQVLQPPGGGNPSAPPEAGEEGAEKTVYIPSDYLPSGLKDGDALRVKGMDEEGCTFVLEPSGEEEGDEAWESDLRKELSPRQPQQEAM